MRTVRYKWGVLLLIVVLLLGTRAAVGADEPVLVQYPDGNFETGPGWPDGWVEPHVPTEIPAWVRDWAAGVMKQNPQLTRLEMRVENPLPNWTREYPYRWGLDRIACGGTIFVFWYAEPDQELLNSLYRRGWTVYRDRLGTCRLASVTSIMRELEMSPEAYEAIERGAELQDLIEASAGHLVPDYGLGRRGDPNAIHVFLNHGYASSHFDVPAYLDTAVNRVRVPIRFVSELMGANVNWDGRAGRVTIYFPRTSREVTRAVPVPGYELGDLFAPYDYFPNTLHLRLEKQVVDTQERTLVLFVGRPVALVDGVEVALDAPPILKDGRTMVPVRFIAERMGAKVYWVGANPIFRHGDGSMEGSYQVHIFTPNYPLFEYPSWYLEKYGAKF